jgi:DNA-binding NarL/FixJ family response regulator
MASTNNISVAIIEDDDEIRELLVYIIDKSPGFSCQLSFKDCESSFEDLTWSCPDVVLMDIDLPGMNGISGVKTLKPQIPDTDFIMLTICEDDETIFSALKAGATGYLLKDTSPVKLLSSITEVRAGGAPMSPGIARKIAGNFQPKSDNPLSERETEILQKLCKGLNYSNIADELFISGNTVKAHIKSIYKKLQVNSRAEAVLKAYNDRLL